MRTALALLMVLTLSLAACGDGDDGNGNGNGDGNADANGATPEAELQVVDLVVGTGDKAEEGSTITFHWTMWLADGEQIATSLGGEPLTQEWDDLIEGWQKGVEGMRVGGTRRLVIPSDMAFGEEGNPDAGVPPGADLTFEIELLAVE